LQANDDRISEKLRRVKRMGLGGANKAAAELKKKEEQAKRVADNVAAVGAYNQQQQERAAAAAADSTARAAIANSFATATTQTPEANKAAKLSVMDFIHTSPEGLLNQPKTGKLNLLGN
jgi:membrane protein involved in colicin uptake